MEIIIKCSDDCRGSKNIYGEPIIEIVRCKECKHWRAYETWSECVLWAGDPYETAKTEADDFCSYGERMKGADDDDISVNGELR